MPKKRQNFNRFFGLDRLISVEKLASKHAVQLIYEAINKQDRFENKIELSAYF